MDLRHFVKVFLLTACTAAFGCGASAQQSEETQKCIQQCTLTSMECLESVDCTDESGQLIPCEAQCEQSRLECEEQC